MVAMCDHTSYERIPDDTRVRCRDCNELVPCPHPVNIIVGAGPRADSGDHIECTWCAEARLCRHERKDSPNLGQLYRVCLDCKAHVPMAAPRIERSFIGRGR